jgi:hypothetical protein
MIISHSQRFIFIANRKTASTAIGITLSSACAPGDVITPLGRDEAIRTELGYPGPRHFIPWRSQPTYWALRLRRKVLGQPINHGLKQIGFHTHITPAQILRYLPKQQWLGYFRFCFVRNPWDRAISQYFWSIRGQNDPISLDDFINGPHLSWAAQHSEAMYSLNGQLAVNRLCRHEEAQLEVTRIFEELGLPGNPQLPEAKRQFRQDRRHYRDVLNSEQAERIASIFSREINLAGYRY